MLLYFFFFSLMLYCWVPNNAISTLYLRGAAKKRKKQIRNFFLCGWWMVVDY